MENRRFFVYAMWNFRHLSERLLFDSFNQMLNQKFYLRIYDFVSL